MTFPFKKFVRKGEKYIMVENGKPEYVLMHYDDYTELIGHENPTGAEESSAPDFASAESRMARVAGEDFNIDTMLSGPSLPEDISKIRLEDLPL